MKYLLIATFVTLSLGGVAYADGFAQTLDKPIGNYIANVDYDSYTPEIYVQNATSYSFQLWNKDRTQTVSFTDVSVNIFQKDNQDNPYDTVFSGTLSGGFGQAGMRLTFPNAGVYMMDVRFHDANYATLAEATFPLTVKSSSSNASQLVGIISGFLLVGGAAYCFGRWQRKILPV